MQFHYAIRMRSPHLELAKTYWRELLRPGDVAIDATCGNGQDTLFLAKLPLSSLFALDVQKSAIEKTEELLALHLDESERKRVSLHWMSHSNLKRVPSLLSPRLIVYNLGYLPGGDKTATTRTESTLESVASALEILIPGGAVSATCYPGHPEGEREEEALLALAAQLPADRWRVVHHRWLNRLRSPSFLWIASLHP